MKRNDIVMAALFCAVLSCVIPFVFGVGFVTVTYVGYPLSVAWLILLGYGFFRYRMRAWGSTLGLPFAFYWPFIFFALYYACRFHHDCF